MKKNLTIITGVLGAFIISIIIVTGIILAKEKSQLSKYDILENNYNFSVDSYNKVAYVDLIESKKSLLKSTADFLLEKKNLSSDAEELIRISQKLKEINDELAFIVNEELSPNIQWVSRKVSTTKKAKN